MSIERGYEIDKMGEPRQVLVAPDPALDSHSDHTGREPAVHLRHGARSRAPYILPALTPTGGR